MTRVGLLSRYAALGSDLEPAQLITRRLAACGFGVHLSHWRDQEELVILNVSGARSCLTLTSCGHAQWHYEPSTGPVTDAATLAAIDLHILSAASPPDRRSDVRAIRREGCPYQGFPLKGAVGRYLQDWGLTVTLRVDEDLESFEATSEIEVTTPPAPGSVPCGSPTTATWTGNATTAPPSTAKRPPSPTSSPPSSTPLGRHDVP